MDNKKKRNLVEYFSYLPLAGSIVAVIISILHYIFMKKEFHFDNIITPLIYFSVFTVIGLFGTKYFTDEFIVKNKNIIPIFIIIFLVIQVLAYFKII